MINTLVEVYMNIFFKNLLIFIGVFIVLVIFDFCRYNKFDLIDNLIQALFFIVVYGLIMWILDDRDKNKKE